MLANPDVATRTAFLFLLLSLCVQGGCATPIEVKNASRAQLALLDALDAAVADLQAGMDKFHKQKEARIKEAGRIVIAQQAIDVAVPSSGPVTSDALFQSSKNKVQLWVDRAFKELEWQQQLSDLTKQIQNTTDPARKGKLQLQKQDLEMELAQSRNKPEEVADVETTIMGNLKDERKTAQSTRTHLQILREQVALMKTMASNVDAWLAVDVTVTQEQMDGLQKTMNTARQLLDGGGQ